MIALVVAADRTLVRQSLAHLLSARPELRVAGEAATGDELFALLSTTSPDLVLLDAASTATLTVRTVRDLSEKSGARIIVTGPFPAPACRSALLRAGASSYLGPETGEAELIREIERVHAGGGEHAEFAGRGAAEGLSSREFDVLCLMGSGLNGRGVATALGLSPKTVSTYRSRILAKLDLGSSAEIVRYAVEHGFTEERGGG